MTCNPSEDYFPDLIPRQDTFGQNTFTFITREQTPNPENLGILLIDVSPCVRVRQVQQPHDNFVLFRSNRFNF